MERGLASASEGKREWGWDFVWGVLSAPVSEGARGPVWGTELAGTSARVWVRVLDYASEILSVPVSDIGSALPLVGLWLARGWAESPG